MTLDEVRERVKEIAATGCEQADGSGDDPQIGHGMEDSLHQDVLTFVAESPHVPADVRAIAREALSTRDLDFPRWYA